MKCGYGMCIGERGLVTLELVLLLPCLKCMSHPFVVLGLLVDAQEIIDSHNIFEG